MTTGSVKGSMRVKSKPPTWETLKVFGSFRPVHFTKQNPEPNFLEK